MSPRSISNQSLRCGCKRGDQTLRPQPNIRAIIDKSSSSFASSPKSQFRFNLRKSRLPSLRLEAILRGPVALIESFAKPRFQARVPETPLRATEFVRIRFNGGKIKRQSEVHESVRSVLRRYLKRFARAIPITPTSSLLLEQLHFLLAVSSET
jgi:hypothetical protein